jgi:hypothetical protein
MRFWFFFLLVLTGVLPGMSQQNKAKRFANDSNYRVELKGEVKNVEVNEVQSKDFSQQFLDIGLRLELRNTGTKPLLFFRQTPDCTIADIAQTSEEFESRTGTFSSYIFATSSYFIDDEQWSANRKWLDKADAPTDKIYKLDPGDSFSFANRVRLPLLTNATKRVLLEPNWKTYRLEELKQLSPFLVQLRGCSMLDFGVSNVKPDRLSFAKELQRRWNNLGYLWLDDITSDPISVDLSSLAFHS